MQKETIFTIFFIKLTIDIENNEVIQLCAKFKEGKNSVIRRDWPASLLFQDYIVNYKNINFKT